MTLPKLGFLPQTSHSSAILALLPTRILQIFANLNATRESRKQEVVYRERGLLLNDVRRRVELAATTGVYFREREGPNGKSISDESGRRRHPQRRLRNFGIAWRWRHGPGVQGAQCVLRSHRGHESAAAESGRSERFGRSLHAGDQGIGWPAPSEYRRTSHGPHD